MVDFDLVIIGAGPAGLSASIYASRYRVKHVIVGGMIGGAMSTAAWVENYPGFERIRGIELSQKMADQAKNLGAEIVVSEVGKIEKTSEGFLVKTSGKGNFATRTLLLATGTQRRKLGISGEDEYVGKGVSYCTTCDGAFFKNKTVVVIGGANAAVMGAIHLSEFASKVYLVYRKKPLRAEPIWVERAVRNPKIEIIYEKNVTEIVGDGSRVSGIKLDAPHDGKNEISLDGVFVEIGGVPGVDLIKPLGVNLDEKGYVKTSPDMSSNVEGLWAAGDIADVSGEFQQIVMAVAEGARAALSIYQFIKKQPLT